MFFLKNMLALSVCLELSQPILEFMLWHYLHEGLAVFMPCFMAHQPAGIQIYLATSFVFTMFQSAALRNDEIRVILGLPEKNSNPKDGQAASEFIKLKKYDYEAREARGDGELLGSGVLAPGWESSKPGRVKASSVTGSAGSGTVLQSPEGFMQDHAGSDPTKLRQLWSPSFQVPIGKASEDTAKVAGGQLEAESRVVVGGGESQEQMASISDAEIEAANRGENPRQSVVMVESDDRNRSEPTLKRRKLTRKHKTTRRKTKKR